MSRFAVFERVSTHSRPKAAGRNIGQHRYERYRFNTQPPEGGWGGGTTIKGAINHVSTHSRPKAAGCRLGLFEVLPSCFNTQPPEGGWVNPLWNRKGINGFNTQPPEGGW